MFIYKHAIYKRECAPLPYSIYDNGEGQQHGSLEEEFNIAIVVDLFPKDSSEYVKLVMIVAPLSNW
jgi:hypothetical protein